MNFSNDNYKLIALNTSTNDYSHTHTPAEAFFILINNLEYNNIDNLCKYISNYYHELLVVFFCPPYSILTFHWCPKWLPLFT